MNRMALAVATLLIAGCVNSSYIRYGSTEYEARTRPGKIVILRVIPTVKYEELGRIEAYGGLGASTGQLIEELRKQASDAGGDAMIDLRFGSTPSTTIINNQVTHVDKPWANATVIRYLE